MIANLALIYNLPRIGVLTGVVLTAALIVAYLLWGGAPDVEELFERVTEPTGPANTNGGTADSNPTGTDGTDARSPTDSANAASAEDDGAATTDRFRVLIPVARPDRAVTYARLAAMIGRFRDRDPLVEIINVTTIPDQTPSETVTDVARERAAQLRELLADASIDADYTVQGHICRDVAFDVLQSAREDEADLIVMGYPEEHEEIAQRIEYNAPCDVLFVSGLADRKGDTADPREMPVVNIGAGGGPHYRALPPVVNVMGQQGIEVYVVSVTLTGDGGTEESVEHTMAGLSGTERVEVHNVSAASVAEGLVSAAAENGGVLLIGATRTRRLRQWVFGSTPDRVIALAADAGVPVFVYAGPTSVAGSIEDYLFRSIATTSDYSAAVGRSKSPPNPDRHFRCDPGTHSDRRPA